MNQRWTLNVRNFGPIQSADIDIHPFMMFVGPNNSGKSYLSTLIWGVLTQGNNNLIALSHFPNRAEICQSMGYEESDILDPKDAMAYQFIMKEGGTVVEPLNLTETGFEAPSFNQTLGDLAAETIKLHDLTDELERSRRKNR